MTPTQFREKLLHFVINEAMADKDMQLADILGSIYVVYVKFRLAYEMEVMQKARKADREGDAK